MARHKILSVGYFGKKNIGDDLFESLISELWPNIDFTFSNSVESCEKFDGIWFGPGDFIDGPDIEEIPNVPVAFLGVGFNPFSLGHNYKTLLSRAKFIVTRDDRGASLFKEIVMPDLAFASHCFSYQTKTNWNIITILLNENLMGKPSEPNWKLNGWEWFSQEFSQVCDLLRQNDYSVQFVPMQVSHQIDDRFPAASIISKMQHRGPKVFFDTDDNIRHYELKEIISESFCVFTARLHGAIFSSQIGTPFVPLIAHDKMRQFCNQIHCRNRVEFYGARKEEIWSAFKEATLSDTDSLVEYSKKAFEKWRNFAATLENKFFG